MEAFRNAKLDGNNEPKERLEFDWPDKNFKLIIDQPPVCPLPTAMSFEAAIEAAAESANWGRIYYLVLEYYLYRHTHIYRLIELNLPLTRKLHSLLNCKAYLKFQSKRTKIHIKYSRKLNEDCWRRRQNHLLSMLDSGFNLEEAWSPAGYPHLMVQQAKPSRCHPAAAQWTSVSNSGNWNQLKISDAKSRHPTPIDDDGSANWSCDFIKHSLSGCNSLRLRLICRAPNTALGCVCLPTLSISLSPSLSVFSPLVAPALSLFSFYSLLSCQSSATVANVTANAAQSGFVYRWEFSALPTSSSSSLPPSPIRRRSSWASDKFLQTARGK